MGSIHGNTKSQIWEVLESQRNSIDSDTTKRDREQKRRSLWDWG